MAGRKVRRCKPTSYDRRCCHRRHGSAGNRYQVCVQIGKAALEIVTKKYRIAVANAFDGDAIAITLADDLVVYRHWGGKASETGSPWFSTKMYRKPGNARRYLALPDGNTAKNVTMFRIPAGTEILYGKVISQAGIPGFSSNGFGGGIQIYLPIPQIAIPIR